MAENIEKLASEALLLPREKRALLAEKLLESLDFEEPFSLSPEWQEEITQRCRDLDDGKSDLVAAEEVLKEARERLK